MKSYKRAIYKTGIIDELPEISCNDTLAVDGAEGIYEVDILIGTDTGITGLRYDAYNIPDRFQLIFDGVTVADSKFVGALTQYPQLLGTSKTLPIFQYDGTAFVDSGLTELITVTSSDIADGSPSEPTAGKGKIEFDKTEATISTMKLRVIGILGGTLWNAAPICPNAGTSTTPSLKIYDMTYYEFIGASECEELNIGGTVKKYYTSENIEIGTKIYSDNQLLVLVPTGFLYLGRTIYEVVDGIITDIYPCSGILLN